MPRTLAATSLSNALDRRNALAGVFCELPCAEAVEIAGLAGWDFVIIDCEHAPIATPMLPNLVRAAAAAGIAPVIRVAANDPAMIQHALDSGAAGVQVPQIASVEAARDAIAAARFHPLGRRGFNPFVRAADFSALAVPEFLEQARETALVLQIESAEGIAAADSILALEGIDVVFIGPYDLSQSLGIPGEIMHPRIFEAAARIARSAGERGVAAGVFTKSLDEARAWLAAGVRYLCYSIDTVLLLDAMRAARADVLRYFET
ncbi:MAG: HpcH/HpaI aldolase family protein [Bryobacteraceae bacterium]